MCLSPYTRRIHVVASAPSAQSPPEPLVNSYMGSFQNSSVIYWGLYRDNGKETGSYYLGFRVQAYMDSFQN